MAVIAQGRSSSTKKPSKLAETMASSSVPDKEKLYDDFGEEVTISYLTEMFGTGFKQDPGFPDNYETMYKKYVALKNNYPLRTEMHKEALITYVKYAYKRDKAIEDDDIEAAEKWGKLCAKQASDAKINPNQLSAADLSDGISNFSKLVEAIEKAQDIIPILPKYKQGPLDAIDYTIWQYVNYIRRLQNLPTVKYADLYKFLEERYIENKGDLPFLNLDRNGHYDDTEEEV